MTVSADLAEQLGLAVVELNTATQLFESIRSDTEQSVNNAVLNLGSNIAKFYVSPVSGNNNNSGGAANDAVQTLSKAIDLAAVPSLSGSYVIIYVEGGHDYHIAQSHDVYNRRIHFVNYNSASKPNIYFDAFPEEGSNFTYFSMYGVSLYDAFILFEGCRVYTPLFSDVGDHDSVFTQPSCGVIRPIKNSVKGLGFRNCEVQMGDQYLLAPVVGDTTMSYFEGSSISFRPGRTTPKTPIELSNNATFSMNFTSTVLNDGLVVQEGSLITGVRFNSGVPANVVCNVPVLEAV